LTGVTINTITRRVMSNSLSSTDATVLETLRQIQFNQSDIGKYDDHISLTDPLAHGNPVSEFFKTLLNFAQHVGEQKALMDSSNNVDFFWSPQSIFHDKCATCLLLLEIV
jgi:hypothetical protein